MTTKNRRSPAKENARNYYTKLWQAIGCDTPTFKEIVFSFFFVFLFSFFFFVYLFFIY